MQKGWIAIFKPGTHTDAAGNTNTWTEDDVKQMAEAYNNQPDDKRHDAPIVKGHPKTDDPAMGWVEKLKYQGGKLLAKLKDVDKNFVEEIRKGLYKKISVRLYSDGKMLRHVGFLGAVPPAIKGLGDAELCEFPQFNDNDSDDFQDEFDIDDTSFAEGDTVKSLTESQQTRSKTYGIAVKASKGLITKPEHYSTLKDEDFADPVHYRFPIQDTANTIVSMQSFNRYDNRQEYDESERQIIGARLVDAAMKHKIDDKTSEIYKHFMYSENKSQFTNQSKEDIVDEKTKAFMDAFIAKLKDSTSEDVATTAQKLFVETFAAEPKPKATKKATDGEEEPKKTFPKFEESDAYQNMLAENQKIQAENKEIKDKLRRKEFAEFLDSDKVKSKISPAQRQSKLDLLEMAYQSGSEFSDADGKKISAVEKVKQDVLATPDVVNLNNLPGGNFNDSDFAEDDKAIDEYQKRKGV